MTQYIHLFYILISVGYGVTVSVNNWFKPDENHFILKCIITGIIGACLWPFIALIHLFSNTIDANR